MFRVAKYLCDRPIRPLKNRWINRSARISTRVDVCFGRDRPPASIYAETSKQEGEGKGSLSTSTLDVSIRKLLLYGAVQVFSEFLS